MPVASYRFQLCNKARSVAADNDTKNYIYNILYLCIMLVMLKGFSSNTSLADSK